MSRSELEASLKRVPFLATLGVTVEEARPGRVVLRLPCAPGNTNHDGALHAGAVFALGETAAAVAASTHPDLAGFVPLQTVSRIKYLRGIAADATAHAAVGPEVVKAVAEGVAAEGEARVEITVQVLDGKGRDVAEIKAGFRFKRR